MSDNAIRFACLVDGDNVTRGGQLGLADVSFVMSYVAHLTERWPVTCALQERVAKEYMPAYAGLGWRIEFAPMGPDAADLVLLDVADGYVARDVTDLLVVSGDHAFAGLASRARLHVLAYHDCLSRELASAAATVTYLDDLIAPVAA